MQVVDVARDADIFRSAAFSVMMERNAALLISHPRFLRGSQTRQVAIEICVTNGCLVDQLKGALNAVIRDPRLDPVLVAPLFDHRHSAVCFH